MVVSGLQRHVVPSFGKSKESTVSDEIHKSEADWRESLTPKQFEVLRKKGTERTFTGAYCDVKDPGTYRCAGCGDPLFSSESKYDSGSGWPSFYEAIEGGRVRTEEDQTLGMRRIEVLCGRCDGHLGHVFPDGPTPTGLRYCINSAALALDTDGASPEGSSDGAPSGEQSSDQVSSSAALDGVCGRMWRDDSGPDGGSVPGSGP